MQIKLLSIAFTLLSLEICCSGFCQNQWIQMGSDVDGDEEYFELGRAVSMPDANTIAVGASFNGGYSGLVRVYEWNGNLWAQKGLDIDVEAWISIYQVSMSDPNTLAIGKPWPGIARVYEWNGISWVQKGQDINGEAAEDWFGYDASMPDANTVAIGAPFNDGNGTNSGNVRIYNWNGVSWVQKGQDINGEAAEDWFGYDASMPDANTVAIGAPGNDGNGTDSGHVRIYYWNGVSWVQKGGDINGEAQLARSGWKVSMPDGNTVAIGNQNEGYVRIYQWNGASWVQKGLDIDGGAIVSMPDANTLAVGANASYPLSSGDVIVYSWNGAEWSQLGNVILGQPICDESQVAICMPNAYTLAIGDYGASEVSCYAGQFRVYGLCTTGVTQITGPINPEQLAESSYSCEFTEGSTYEWTVTNGVIITGQGTNQVTVLWGEEGAGVLSVIETTAEGCQSIPISMEVGIVCSATATNITGPLGPVELTETTYTCNGAPGSTYFWTISNGIIASGQGTNTVTVIWADAGLETITVQETTANGCPGNAISLNVVVIHVSVEEQEANNLVVYPNPTCNEIILTGDKMSSDYTLYSHEGKQVLTGRFAGESAVIDLSELESGVYILHSSGCAHSVRVVRE